jgi:CRP/FNR family transcriptional regulator
MDSSVDISELGKTVNYSKGQYIFHQNDRSQGFYQVLKGRVRLYRLGSEAKEVEISLASCEDYLAEVTLFAADKYPVSAQAIDDCELLFFEKESFLQQLESQPEYCKFMLELLAKKCITLNERLDTLNIQSPRQRLIRNLISSCSGDGRCEIQLSMKKVDLARHIGVTPEALSRNIKALQDDGLIKVDGNLVRVINCSELKRQL